MNIDALRNFIIIAEEENISSAAKKLHMAQPPLSRQLKALEDDLEVSLFYRNKQRIHLTEEGKYLLDSAKSIVETIDKTKRQIKEIGQDKKGTLYIGSTEAAFASILPDAIRIFNKENPEIMYHMYNAPSEDICKALSSNKMDVGCIIEPYNTELYDGIRVYSGKYVAIFHKDSPLALNPDVPVTVAELSKQPLILSTRKATQKPILNAFLASNADVNVICEYSLLMTALSMVKINLGTAVAASSAINMLGNDGSLAYRYIIEPEVEYHISIIKKKQDSPENVNPMIDYFWSFIQKRFAVSPEQ